MVNNMTFVSDEHKKFYYDHQSITSLGPDYKALVYTLGINPDCREHFFELYDVKDQCIFRDAIDENWQTGSSRSITRLAFNLFTWSVPSTDSPVNYSPKYLFWNLGDIQRHGALLAIEYFA